MFQNDDEQTLSDFYDYAAPATVKASPLLITNDHVGVEIELENAGSVAPSSEFWHLVEDHSLRDNGRELIFSRPLNGVNVVAALDYYEDLLETLRKASRTPTLSARTSIHVHVNMGDLSPSQLATTIMLYALFERAIFKTYAESRICNHFCIPFTECLDFVNIARALAGGWQGFEKEFNVPDIDRYCALNTKSLFKHGTLEFRHCQASMDKEYILEWINTCLAFKRGGRGVVNFREEFFTQSAQGFDGQLRKYLPVDTVNRILTRYKDISELNYDISCGVRFVQQCLLPRIATIAKGNS